MRFQIVSNRSDGGLGGSWALSLDERQKAKGVKTRRVLAWWTVIPLNFLTNFGHLVVSKAMSFYFEISFISFKVPRLYIHRTNLGTVSTVAQFPCQKLNPEDHQGQSRDIPITISFAHRFLCYGCRI